MQIVNKRNGIIAIGVVVVILIILALKLMLSGPINASPYTKVALKPGFSQAFIGHFGIPSDTTPSFIEGNMGQGMANVMVYVYYACQDYQAGKINKKEFLQVMENTKPVVDWLTQQFNPAYDKVMTYPVENMSPGGLSYVETESDGSKNWNTANYTKLQKVIVDLVNQMYQSQDPNQIWQDVEQFGVYMEQGTFYFSNNTQYGLDQISTNNFKSEWILGNTLATPDSVQQTLTQLLH